MCSLPRVAFPQSDQIWAHHGALLCGGPGALLCGAPRDFLCGAHHGVHRVPLDAYHGVQLGAFILGDFPAVACPHS